MVWNRPTLGRAVANAEFVQLHNLPMLDGRDQDSRLRLVCGVSYRLCRAFDLAAALLAASSI